ncbi:MAG: DinB family protein [Actinomycetota bacterium]|nr:DinB family protein [Actinomycetota bacterium]
MHATDLLVDALGRIRDTVHEAVDGLDEEQLATRIAPQANTIAWLVWHLTRVQDDHLAEAAGSVQVWTSDGWVERFRLGFDGSATGYGHSYAEVGRVRASAELLSGYHDAVHARSTGWVRSLDTDALERVVDESWDPPVTLAVRLVSVIDDDIQHAGQAAFIRGILERGTPPPAADRGGG